VVVVGEGERSLREEVEGGRTLKEASVPWLEEDHLIDVGYGVGMVRCGQIQGVGGLNCTW
jgi:hypothetical protein